MTNLKKLNSNLRAANSKKKPKSKESAKRDDATLEILRSINSSVEKLGQVKPPVVNIPERKPYSYKATFGRSSSTGEMISAEFHPILEK